MDATRDRRASRNHPVMADVAAIAGVSQMTVSRVLNERPGVSDPTRQRVLAAIRELDYRPNAAARTLVTGRSGTLGVVTFQSALYGPSATLSSIEVAARAANYSLTVSTLPVFDRGLVSAAVRPLRRGAIDGVIAIAPDDRAVRAVRGELGGDVPFVTIQSGGREGVPTVAIDQTLGASQATRHLLSLGHRTVWHIAGPTDWCVGRDRAAAWREVLRAERRRVHEPLIGDWSADAGYHHGRSLAARRDVTAVFVANDQMAIGVLRAFSEAGRAAPTGVSVVGFDDLPESAHLIPTLTTVRQDFSALGRRGLELLLDQIEHGRSHTEPALIEPELVLRESTTRPPSTPPATLQRSGR